MQAFFADKKLNHIEFESKMPVWRPTM